MLGATQSTPPPSILRNGAEAKRSLLEALLASQDGVACAQMVTDWLVEHVGIQQACCALVDADACRLGAVAATAVSFERGEAFSIPLEDDADRLVAALGASGPVYLGAGKTQRSPIEGPCHAVPLRADRADRSVGLLLASAAGPAVDGNVGWAARVLGSKLASLSASAALEAAQQRLGRDRALLASALEGVTDPVVVTDVEGKLLVANSHASQLFTAPDEATEGRRSAVALNAMLFSASLASVAMQERTRRELTLVDPADGSDLLFEHLASAPRAQPSGEPCYVSILRNVTDLGRAKRELEESGAKLRAAEAAVRMERRRLSLIIDSVADPIVVTDARGDVLLMNAPAEKLFSVAPGGPEDVERIVRSNDAHFTSFVSALLAGGSNEVWRSDVVLADPSSGRRLPVEAVAGKVVSERNELLAIVSILHDQTVALEKDALLDRVRRSSDELREKVREATAELAKQNELLRRQTLEVEQASALKSQFLANMSHEFRTPLNAILGYASLLLEGASGPLSVRQRRNVERVESNGRHLLELVSEILDITRIEAGRMPVHVDRFTAAELLREVLAELEPVIERAPIPVRTDVDPRLPALQTDRKKVKQILVNFLTNALKFTREGAVTVRVRRDRPAGQTLLSVEDTGIGIAPEHLERVFEDFHQLDTALSRPHGGTGLGLGICRRLAAMLNGRITLKSQVGAGSAFVLHLPRLKRTRRR